MLARELEALTARDDELRPVEVAERGDRAGGGREQVLGVVEQDQHPLAAEHLREHVLERPVGLLDHVERLRRLPEHERRVAERGERHPPDALGEVVRGLGGGLEREPGLAGAAGAREREQADAVPELLDDLAELARAAEELGRRHGEVRPAGAFAAAGTRRVPSWKSRCGAERSLSRCSPRSRTAKLVVEQVAGRSG